jgi:hypothetical protein
MVDILFDYRIGSDQSKFSIHPKFDRLGLRVTTRLRFLAPNRPPRAFEYEGGDPGLIRLDPLWHQAAWQFTQMGFFHLLNATDVLVLLFCLAIPIHAGYRMALAIAMFTIGQSTALFVSASGMASTALWVQPAVATLIGLAIVVAALENIAAPPRLDDRRWLLAYAFGLISGFGMAFFVAGSLQFGGSHPSMSVLSFSAGVIAAELLATILIVLVLDVLIRFVGRERIAVIVLSAVAAHSGWHWMESRYADLRRFPLGWPTVDTLFLLGLVRWAMVAVIVAATIWLAHEIRDKASNRLRRRLRDRFAG